MKRLAQASQRCSACRREFEPPTVRWTLLHPDGETRQDFCETCWLQEKRGDGQVCWKSLVLPRGRSIESRDAEVRRVEVVIAGLDLLAEERDYLLGLYLLKRKLAVLAEIDESVPGQPLWRLRVRGRKELFEVRDLGERILSVRLE